MRRSERSAGKGTPRPTGRGALRASGSRKARASADSPAEPEAGPVRRYLKGRSVCRVTFTLPAAAVLGGASVHIAGEFNGWEPDVTPMSRQPDGGYRAAVDLEPGREYRFRYLVDGCRWENDWRADRYEPNPYGGFDSVIAV